jgi:hypothetical protein
VFADVARCEVLALVDARLQSFAIDTLVNNASDSGPIEAVEDDSTEDRGDAIDSCLRSAYLCTRFVVPAKITDDRMKRVIDAKRAVSRRHRHRTLETRVSRISHDRTDPSFLFHRPLEKVPRRRAADLLHGGWLVLAIRWAVFEEVLMTKCIIAATAAAALCAAAGCNRQLPASPDQSVAATASNAVTTAAAADRSQPLVVTGACSIDSALAQYRTALGALNPNVVGEQPGGRREINWDAVPAAATNTTTFPADFFNQPVTGRARGTVFSTDGSGLSVSDNDFFFINPAYADVFNAFSPVRTFMAIDSNTIRVDFFVAGTSTPALSTGFGVVFSDVDNNGSAAIKLIGENGNSLGKYQAPACAGGFSFVGVMFPSRLVAAVEITSGHGPLGADNADVSDRDHGPARDLVITDDFIYGEPRARQ